MRGDKRTKTKGENSAVVGMGVRETITKYRTSFALTVQKNYGKN